MQLDFTTDQEALRDAVRDVLAKECPTSRVRDHVESIIAGRPSPVGAELWATFRSLDWPGLTVPEAYGGVGLGAVELAILAEELGRVVAPGPLLATIAGFAPLLTATGDAGADWLRRVASGGTTGAAVIGPLHGDAETAVHTAGSLECRNVTGVLEADELAIPIELDGGWVVAVVRLADVRVDPVDSLDPTRSLGHVTFEVATVPPDRLLPTSREAVEQAAEVTVTAAAAELVGTCQTIFDTNLAYAKERVQFGVPIGSFQAVKHKLVNMYVAIERARAAAYFAALAIDENDDRRSVAASMAKAAAGECQRLVAQDGIQLLGGIGYTWEHDQQLFVKRAKTAEVLHGTAAEHRARVARAILS